MPTSVWITALEEKAKQLLGPRFEPRLRSCCLGLRMLRYEMRRRPSQPEVVQWAVEPPGPSDAAAGRRVTGRGRVLQNVKLVNFSTSWADGLAFCALLHHFLPDAFDYAALTPERRRHNFTLAFKIADEKAGIYPLLDVDDMVAMRKPDWKCVFTYVQAIHRRFRDLP